MDIDINYKYRYRYIYIDGGMYIKFENGVEFLKFRLIELFRFLFRAQKNIEHSECVLAQLPNMERHVGLILITGNFKLEAALHIVLRLLPMLPHVLIVYV